MGAPHATGPAEAMCLSVYVASDVPLPHGEWEAPSRDIRVSEVREAMALSRIFSKRHVYVVSAEGTGDGCGFCGDHPAAMQAREALAAFLELALARVPEVEMFIDGANAATPGVEPSSYDVIGPSDVRTWRSGFQAGEFLLVTRED